MSSDNTSKSWVPSGQLYGKPIGINQLAYANGTYLAYADDHPASDGCFETIFICDDLVNWQHRNTDITGYNLSNVLLTSYNDCFVAAATANTATGKKLVAFISDNGFEWSIRYETPDTSDSYVASSLFVVSGRLALGYIGGILVTTDTNEWGTILLPKEYSTAVVLGSTTLENSMHFLIKQGTTSHLALTSNGIDFEVHPTPWSTESFAIAGNGSQVLVSCKTENTSCVVFFSSDITAYEVRDIPVLPDNTMNEFVTVPNMVWIDNEWFVVCNREFHNTGGMKFSVVGCILRNNGVLTSESPLIKDDIQTKHITTVSYINNQLVAFGNAFPTPDNCLYTVMVI